jgi:hypothetical protein
MAAHTPIPPRGPRSERAVSVRRALLTTRPLRSPRRLRPLRPSPAMAASHGRARARARVGGLALAAARRRSPPRPRAGAARSATRRTLVGALAGAPAEALAGAAGGAAQAAHVVGAPTTHDIAAPRLGVTTCTAFLTSATRCTPHRTRLMRKGNKSVLHLHSSATIPECARRLWARASTPRSLEVEVVAPPRRNHLVHVVKHQLEQARDLLRRGGLGASG